MSDEHNNTFLKLRDAGFERLIPIIPPDAELSANSNIPLSARGKTPGKPNMDGTWHGYDWMHNESTERGFKRWFEAGAGVGVVCGNVIGLDIDVDDPDLAANLHKLAVEMLGKAPARTGQPPRTLLVYERIADAGESDSFSKLHINYNGGEHLIEVRGSGHQFVAYGTHASTGRPYTWDRELYDVGRHGLSTATREQVNNFMVEAADLVDMLGGETSWRSSGGGQTGQREAVNQDDLVADKPDELAKVIQKMPNTDHDFPERDDYIRMGCAIKAAFVNDPARGFELWKDWCERWDGGENDPDRMVSDWQGMQPPFSIGADWIVKQAAALGVPGAAASVFEDEPTGNNNSANDADDLVDGADSDGNKPDTRNPVKVMFENYCYVEPLEQFVDIRTGRMMSKTQFSVRLAGLVGKGTYGKGCAAEMYIMDHRRRRMLQGVTFRPKRGLWLKEDGEDVVNLWQPTPAMQRGWDKLTDVTDADIEPWLDLIHRHLPDAETREVVIDWLAWQIQHPGSKCNFHLLWTGEQGVGKDSLIQFLLRAIGEGDHGQATNQPANVILSDWTDYIEYKSLVVIQEVHTFSRKEVSNSLKPLLACPPNYIQVHKKFRQSYPIPNVVNMIMLSNHDDALSLERGDRRVMVLRSACEQTDFTDAYFERFHNWLDNGGDRLLTGWMAKRDLSAFSPRQKAPMTDAKADMIGLSMGVVENHIKDAIEDRDNVMAGDLATSDELLEWVRTAAPNGERISSTRLARILTSLGCRKLGRVRINGERKRVWVIRNVDKYRDMPSDAIGEAYDFQRRRRLSEDAGDTFS